MLLFIASVKSQKTINAFKTMVSCLLHQSHIQNGDSKQRRKQHYHQMHDKPKYENGKCLVNLVIGWVKYMGEFYM